MVHEDDQEPLCDPRLDRLPTVALYEDNYKALIDNVQKGFPFSRDKANASVTPFVNIKNELSVHDGIVLYGPSIIVPKSARCEVLASIHESHQGTDRTNRRARQKFIGPSLVMTSLRQWLIAISANNIDPLSNESHGDRNIYNTIQ